MDKNLELNILIEMMNNVLFKDKLSICNVESLFGYLYSIKKSLPLELYENVFKLIIQILTTRKYENKNTTACLNSISNNRLDSIH